MQSVGCTGTHYILSTPTFLMLMHVSKWMIRVCHDFLWLKVYLTRISILHKLSLSEKNSGCHGLVCHVTGTTQVQQMHRITCMPLPWQRSMRQQSVMFVANCFGMYDCEVHLKHRCIALLVFTASTDCAAVLWVPATAHFISVKLLVSFLP